jgi:DNA mismatch endonuclease Vsr
MNTESIMGRNKEITSSIMSKIKSRDTKPEILFRKMLWNQGVRFKFQNEIFGKPDIAFKKYKIAIFIDGDFWHGNNWKLRKLSSLEDELKSYSQFWKTKILRNIDRDKTVNLTLKADGWIVLRFWASALYKNPKKCIDRTLRELRKRGYGA